jgi:hypothetical protein
VSCTAAGGCWADSWRVLVDVQDYVWEAVQSRLEAITGKRVGPGFLTWQVVTWVAAPKTLDRAALTDALQTLGLRDISHEAARSDLPALRELLAEVVPPWGCFSARRLETDGNARE